MPYLIAEIGPSHEGKLEKAKELIRLASDTGVDAVKFQIYKAEKLVHPDVPAMVKTHNTQYERFKSLEFSYSEWSDLYQTAQDCNVDFLATCFDVESLNEWGNRLKYIKIASGDLTYHQLIRKAVNYGKPVLLSTGGAQKHEIKAAADIIPQYMLIVMQCVSMYPTPMEHANLGMINELKKKYRVGYSDHTKGIEACIYSAVLGCEVIEKHFTDKRRDYGDHIHAATPSEMERLVLKLDDIRTMLGTTKPVMYEDMTKLRRGAYASKNISKGDIITEENTVALRPCYGFPPHRRIGRKARKNYKGMDKING